jgi:hypothetical protein
MFTIPSLPKLLLIVLVIGAVWWFFRRTQVKHRERDELDRQPRSRVKKNQAAKPIEDMKQCRVSNAYVPAAGASRCGRENCPF